MEDWFSFNNIKSILETLAVVIVGLSIFYKKLQSEIKKYGKDKMAVAKHIKKQTELDLEILEELKKVREQLEVDRVCVFEFHNGEHYANGREALRTSCTYEAYRYGLESIKNRLQGLALSIFPNVLKDLFEKDSIHQNDIKDVEEKYPNLALMFNQFGIKAHYTKLITDDTNQPIGFVSVYENESKSMNKLDARLIERVTFFIEERIVRMSKEH